MSLALNTYTSVELAYATSYFTALNGTWTLANNSWWNGSATLPDDAQWRAALAAIGSKQFSEEMWPCSEADNAEWQCSDITQSQDQSYSQCNVVRQLAPKGELAGAFAYHEVGIKPHTMLTWEEIDDVSSACGGCKVLLHTRMYSGLWKGGVDTVLAHPQLLGVVFERAPTSLAIADLGSFAEAMLAAGKQPFFLLPFKAFGKDLTGMTAAEQMHRFLRGVEKHSSPSVLDDPRVNIVIARYGTGLSHLKPPPFPPPSPSPIVPPQPPPSPPSPHKQISPDFFLPIFGDGDDTVAAAVAVALLARDEREARRRKLRDLREREDSALEALGEGAEWPHRGERKVRRDQRSDRAMLAGTR